MNVDGQLLRVGVMRVATQAPPLLLFNGIGANLELLLPFVRAMRDVGVATIAFDVPGAGGSPASTFPYRYTKIARLGLGVAERLGFAGPVDALGISWGGGAAQEFAHQFPERCRRLILAATSAGAVMVPGRWSAISLLISPRRYKDPEFMAEVGGTLYGGTLRHDKAQLQEHSRHFKPPHGRGYLYQLLSTVGWTSVLWLRRLKQPTLVMMGTDDPIVPLINGRLLAAVIPHAQLFTIDDGHLFLLSRPKEVATKIRDFLAEDDARVPMAVAQPPGLGLTQKR